MKSSLERVLAVDIGTSSVRAMVFDAAGHILARSQIAYSTTRPAPYFEEQDPDLVRHEVYRAIKLCLAQPGADPEKIGAIGFSSQMYGVIALDAAGKPLTNNILWSDGRAEPQAEAMKKTHGEHWLYPETGCPMNSIFPLAKLAWLREVRPEVFGSARRFVSIKEYVTFALVGEWVVDYSMASATGMLDVRSHRWHPTAIEAAGVREDQLSRPVSGLEKFVLGSDSPLAGCGLPVGVRVFLGGGDGPLANLGSGASAIGAVNIDLGTSGAARCITDAPTVDDTASLWCFCLTDDLWAYGGIVTNVGNAYQWLGSNVIGVAGMDATQAYDLMNRLAAEVEPGADGLYFLPYLRKARSPYWDGRLKGTLYGLTADHGAGHMARAMLEAVAYDLRSIIGIMKQRTTIASHIVLTGGLAKSPIIPQLLADVLNMELRTPEDGEGSIAGAAILALHGLGAIDALAFSGGPRAYRSFIPNSAQTGRYDRAYRGYVKLVCALRQIDLQEGEFAVKVLVTSKSFGRVAPDAIETLKANGIEVVWGSKPSMTAKEIAAEIAGFDALVVGNDTVDASVFAAADRLRLVHMHGTGLDAINVSAATDRGILVANAPGANRNAVAELTVALMLVAARSIDKHIDILKAGRWERTAGHEISGKTVGILGLGNVGKRIVELLSGFGVKVTAFDVQPDQEWAARFGVALAASVDDVFAKADFLVLALSLNPQTKGIVDARRLALMKHSAYLINTARGGLVDEEALRAAINDKKIAGAALDAFDPEPLPMDSCLRGIGITLTPHLAATSVEAAGNVSRIVARNVVDVLVRGHQECAVNAEAVGIRFHHSVA